MIELLFSLALLLGPGPWDYDEVPLIDCVIFADGIKSHEQVMAECIEYAEGYEWDTPIYEDDYPHDCTAYQSWEEIAAECDAYLGLSQSSSYTIQDGDLSLWSISQKYGIPFGALLDANPNSDLIRVGDRINLP